VKSWVEISGKRLRANYKALNAAAGDETSVLAVVKADAYGHGAVLCAPVLAAAGAEWLGVTSVAEGAFVRFSLASEDISFDQQPHVLVMSEMLPEDAEAIVSQRLTPVVSSIEQIESFADTPPSFGVHLEIDTGMARQGVAVGSALDRVLKWISTQRAVRLDGVMTHFASSEIAGSHQTSEQRTSFENAIRQVATHRLKPAWIHAGNSSTIDNPAEGPLRWLETLAQDIGARAMVRSGLALYGYTLPIEREQAYTEAVKPQVRTGLKPVMTWKARVTSVREIEAGQQIGYNGTFIAERRMRLALLPIGYADGLRRELSSTNLRPGGWVILHGKRAPIVGRVSMNLTIVDVTGIPSVSVGDEAILLGEGITAEDHAQLAGTIPYEILCSIRAGRILR
jgi:alanine racemase